MLELKREVWSELLTLEEYLALSPEQRKSIRSVRRICPSLKRSDYRTARYPRSRRGKDFGSVYVEYAQPQSRMRRLRAA